MKLSIAAVLLAAHAAAAAPAGSPMKAIPQVAVVTVAAKAPGLSDYALHAGTALRKPWFARLLDDARAKKLSAEASPKSIFFEGTTEVQFTVAPDGSVSDPKMTTASGMKTLDAAAVDVLKGLVLPALPAGVTDAPQLMTARFNVKKTSESALIEYLELLHRKNMF